MLWVRGLKNLAQGAVSSLAGDAEGGSIPGQNLSVHGSC